MIDTSKALELPWHRSDLVRFTSRGWRVESDGCAAIAWPGDTKALDRLKPEVDALLWPAVAALAPVDLAALREWLRPLVPPPPPEVDPAPVQCKHCRGTGIATCSCRQCGDEHSCTCPDCDGEGKVMPDEPPKPPRPSVSILGFPFDARRLARALGELPSDAAEWTTLGPSEDEALLIVGDGWRFVLMRQKLDPWEPVTVWSGPKRRAA